MSLGVSCEESEEPVATSIAEEEPEEVHPTAKKNSCGSKAKGDESNINNHPIF